MTTTESQITSGKAESIKKLRELARKAQIDGWPFYGIAYQKASSPDVVLELIERAEKAEAERDHFKAKWEANRAGREYAELSDKELSDPEYMRAYVEGCQDGFATMLESRNHFKAIAERRAAGLAGLQLLHVGKRGLLLVGQNPIAGAPNYVRYSEVAAMVLPSQQEPVEETANTTDTEQLPCPFCDSSNISAGEVLTEINANDYAQSECQGCGALGPRAWLAPDEVDYGDVRAIAAWNRRALLSPAQQEPASPIADFIASQKPMDADIAKIVGDNLWSLYATDEAEEKREPAVTPEMLASLDQIRATVDDVGKSLASIRERYLSPKAASATDDRSHDADA